MAASAAVSVSVSFGTPAADLVLASLPLLLLLRVLLLILCFPLLPVFVMLLLLSLLLPLFLLLPRLAPSSQVRRSLVPDDVLGEALHVCGCPGVSVRPSNLRRVESVLPGCHRLRRQ